MLFLICEINLTPKKEPWYFRDMENNCLTMESKKDAVKWMAGVIAKIGLPPEKYTHLGYTPYAVKKPWVCAVTDYPASATFVLGIFDPFFGIAYETDALLPVPVVGQIFTERFETGHVMPANWSNLPWGPEYRVAAPSDEYLRTFPNIKITEIVYGYTAAFGFRGKEVHVDKNGQVLQKMSEVSSLCLRLILSPDVHVERTPIPQWVRVTKGYDIQSTCFDDHGPNAAQELDSWAQLDHRFFTNKLAIMPGTLRVGGEVVVLCTEEEEEELFPIIQDSWLAYCMMRKAQVQAEDCKEVI